MESSVDGLYAIGSASSAATSSHADGTGGKGDPNRVLTRKEIEEFMIRTRSETGSLSGRKLTKWICALCAHVVNSQRHPLFVHLLKKHCNQQTRLAFKGDMTHVLILRGSYFSISKKYYHY